MNAFAEIFDETQAFLKSKGISVEMVKGRRASRAEVVRFRTKTGMALPESFLAFYTHFADGLYFAWEKDEQTNGCLAMPPLAKLAAARRHWIKDTGWFLNAAGELELNIAAKYRAKAMKIATAMKSWLPFWREPNGDSLCVDLVTGRIIYDQHDWFDGFGSLAQTNGAVAGGDLLAFVTQWSRFCFQANRTLWWGTLVKLGKIQWKRKCFDSEFYRGE